MNKSDNKVKFLKINYRKTNSKNLKSKDRDN